MIFPRGGNLARHPSQLYEAALEGLVLFAVLLALVRFARALEKPGFVTGGFITGYGVARFIVEFFREPDSQLGYLAFGTTMGQWLSLPLIVIGIALMAWAMKAAARRARQL